MGSGSNGAGFTKEQAKHGGFKAAANKRKKDKQRKDGQKSISFDLSK